MSGKKNRKPYTITKPREAWSKDEHQRFLDALKLYERDWKKIGLHVGTKTIIQIRSHAQKYFQKMAKIGHADLIPPPRPKRKSVRKPKKKEDEKPAPSDSKPQESTPDVKLQEPQTTGDSGSELSEVKPGESESQSKKRKSQDTEKEADMMEVEKKESENEIKSPEKKEKKSEVDPSPPKTAVTGNPTKSGSPGDGWNSEKLESSADFGGKAPVPNFPKLYNLLARILDADQSAATVDAEIDQLPPREQYILERWVQNLTCNVWMPVPRREIRPGNPFDDHTPPATPTAPSLPLSQPTSRTLYSGLGPTTPRPHPSMHDSMDRYSYPSTTQLGAAEYLELPPQYRYHPRLFQHYQQQPQSHSQSHPQLQPQPQPLQPHLQPHLQPLQQLQPQLQRHFAPPPSPSMSSSGTNFQQEIIRPNRRLMNGYRNSTFPPFHPVHSMMDALTTMPLPYDPIGQNLRAAFAAMGYPRANAETTTTEETKTIRATRPSMPPPPPTIPTRRSLADPDTTTETTTTTTTRTTTTRANNNSPPPGYLPRSPGYQTPQTPLPTTDYSFVPQSPYPSYYSTAYPSSPFVQPFTPTFSGLPPLSPRSYPTPSQSYSTPSMSLGPPSTSLDNPPSGYYYGNSD